MPGGDRTGPMGMGSMTGRGMGYCAGEPVPGFSNAPGGRGRGFGGGGGGRGRHGRRNRFHATGLTGWQRAEAAAPASETSADSTPAVQRRQTLEMLKSEAQRHASALEQISERIAGLEADLRAE